MERDILKEMTARKSSSAERYVEYRSGKCDVCGETGQAYLAFTEVHYEIEEIAALAMGMQPARVFWIDAYCEKCGKMSALMQGKDVVRIVWRLVEGEPDWSV
jgi:hypothetical protein